MQIRRVVTGHSPEGKAIFVSDSMVDPVTVRLLPGTELFRMWGTDETVTLPDDGAMPSHSTYFPPVGGFRFGLFTVPPLATKIQQSDESDIESALAEVETKLPGFLNWMEPDNPGMHTTDTVDFEYVISGEVWLELDNGKEIHLEAGDTVIQNGNRHAWRNKGTEPCQMVVCLIGANRK